MNSDTPTPSSEPTPQPEPQAGNKKSSNKLWLWLSVGVLGLAGGGFILSRMQQGNAQVGGGPPPATAVAVEQLQATPVKVSSEFIGALEAQERVILRPEAAGRITEILVEDGDRVTAGTAILQLSPERPEAVVGSAIADIAVANASRQAAQAALLEAEADRDSAIAERDLQATEYKRIQTLVDEGALAQRALDEVVRNRDRASAVLKAAERRIQVAQANLGETDATLKRARANAAVATEDLSDYQVIAPIDGVVGDLPIKVGDYINTGEALTTLTRNEVLDLRLSIPVERAAALRTGLPVELRAEAGGAPLAVGQISFVAERIANEAQSILAKATFNNPNGLLRDEQFVRATVVWAEEPSVLVPTTAVSQVGGQGFVFVMEPSAEATGEFIAAQRPIKLGVIEGNRYQVVDGLEPGETIITAGTLRLIDGSPVMPE